MIQKGIFAKTFARSSVQEVLEAVKMNNFSVAQFNFACVGLASMPDTIPESIIKEIKVAKLATGINFVGLSGTFNMAHPEKAVREEGLKKLEVLAEACSSLNIHLISLCTGSRDAQDKWKHHPENQSKEAWTDMMNSMEKALLIGEKFDLQLGIEPELANVVDSPSKAKQLLSDFNSSRLKIILDPANLFEQAKIPKIKYLIEEALDLLAPALVMVHAKDRNIEGAFVPPGRGIIPFGFFIEKLKELNFKGSLVAHGFSESDVFAVSKYLDSIL